MFFLNCFLITAVSPLLFSFLIHSTTVDSTLTLEMEQDMELKAEMYYNAQKIERKNVKQQSREGEKYIGSNWPCIRGVVPIGSDSKVDVTEGHKYGCGIHMIKSSPIVYSFGSNKNTEFEIDVLNLRSDANVWIYELDPARMPSDKRTGLHVGNFGLGGYGRGTPGNMRSLGALMKENNHTYIDILKMDIEGFEWSFLEKEDALLERVGVFLVEVHSILASISSRAPKGPMRSTHAPFIEAVEKRDLRLYHQEINAGSHKCCSEYAFIQKNTSMWDSKTKFQFLSLL